MIIMIIKVYNIHIDHLKLFQKFNGIKVNLKRIQKNIQKMIHSLKRQKILKQMNSVVLDLIKGIIIKVNNLGIYI